MSSKYAIVAIAVVAAILLSGVVREPVHADDTFEVKSVTLSSDPIVAGKPVDISVELLSNDNVTGVSFNVCTAINCFLPDVLAKGTDGIWTGTTTTVTDLVEHYYTVGVSFDNGTTLFTGKTYFTPVSENLDVKSIAHAPMKVVLDTEVDVYAELNSTEHVDKVQLYHCQGDACFAPIEMTELENGTYHARIGPFETEDEVKYNVTTIFRDGGRTWVQFTTDISFRPVKGSTGNGDDDDDGGIIPAMGAVAVLAVLAGLAVGRRRKDREE